MRLGVVAAAVCLSLVALSVAADAQAAIRKQTNIPAQALAPALKTLAKERNFQIVYVSEQIRDQRTQGAHGEFTPEEALKELLSGTGLTFKYLDEMTVTIVPVGAGPAEVHTARLPSAFDIDSSADAEASDQDGNPIAKDKGALNDGAVVREQGVDSRSMPEVLVRGARVLNTDIKRSRDDAQPYVVYDRAVIESSGAASIHDFFKQRLPMNSIATSAKQSSGALGNGSTIDLRGLGTNQTLVLIDGRRAAGINLVGSPGQADLTGIPLAAVERIEVLPTTASGIYGGSATGGVINVVLRRDYQGADVKLTYDNTFSADSSRRQVDFTFGLNHDDGRTQLLLAGSYSDQNALMSRDRDLLARGRAQILSNNGNNPQALNIAGPIPPLGATTNIRSLNGSPLFGPGSSNIAFVPVGYAAGGGIAPLSANAGQYNLDVADTAQAVGGGRNALLNGPIVASVNGTLRQAIGGRVEAFLDLAASKNDGDFPTSQATGIFVVPATASYNPFGQGIIVTVPIASLDSRAVSDIDNERAAAGVIVELPGEWNAAADYTWSRSRLDFAFAPALAPSATAAVAVNLDVLRDTNAFPVDFSPFVATPISGKFEGTLKNAALRFSGPIYELPGGPVGLSTLLESREEDFGDGIQFIPGFDIFIPSRSQSVDSVYVEAKVPVVSDKNRVAGVRDLELQLAARYDDYSVEGSTSFIQAGSTTPIERRTNERSSTNPTFGLRYRPGGDVMLRASYGTGFLPPSVNQLVPAVPAIAASNAIDPRRGNTPTGPVQGISGGNPDLRPEESESISVGAVLTPRFLPGVRLSVDYTKIDKTDNITNLSAQQILNNEDVFPGRVTRGPVAPGDPFGVGPVTFVDTRATNVAQAEIEAYDVQLDLRRETVRIGTFDFFALATWQTHFTTQLTPTSPWTERVGVGVGLSASSFPLKFRANAGLTWRYGQWALGWTSSYYDSYYVADPSSPASAPVFVNQGAQRVDSQDYHDAFVKWSTPSLGVSRLLSDIEVQLGVRNVFNTKPPFDASNVLGYYSLFGDPRLASYYVSVKGSF